MTATPGVHLKRTGVRFGYLAAAVIALGAAAWAGTRAHAPWWYLERAAQLGWYPARWNAPLAGHWSSRFEVSSFVPCPGMSGGITPRGPWWTDVSGEHQALFDRVWGGRRPRPDTTVFVAWYADVSRAGAYGHMGQYDRAIALREVTAVRPAAPNDCTAARKDSALFRER